MLAYWLRIIYETAVARLAAEYSTIFNIDIEVAKEKVIATAKDRINSESKNNQNHDEDFDQFDKEESEDDEEEDEDDEEEDEDDEDIEEDDEEVYEEEDEE